MTTPLVYLDNNATTRAADEVVAAMLPTLTEEYGNASSAHRHGTAAGALVEQARAHVAALIGARPGEVIFTSGGTESDTFALRGVLAARPDKRHLVISAVEHAAVIESAAELERQGYAVTRIGVDGAGRLDLAGLAAALRDDTALVSIMLANNETGVIMPVREVVTLCQPRGIPVHTDAVQAAGKIPIDVAALGVHLLSLSAHKFHGPKGGGALYVRRGTPLRPLLLGGPHERGRRGGTLDTPGIVGMGVAAELARTSMADEMPSIAALRDRLEREILARVPGAVLIAGDVPRVPNTTCFCFTGIAAEPLLVLLSELGVCASSGAACSSGALEPSHVLEAMGVPPPVAQGQVRFSLSRYTTDAEIDRVLELLPAAVRKVAAINVS